MSVGTRPAAANTEPIVSESAFREMYPRLRRFAAAVADTDMDPDDLLQDALAGLLRVEAGSVRDVRAYLRRAILNAVARERGRAARIRAADGTAGGVSTPAVPADYPSHVRALLTSISPQDRALLYLLDIERLPVVDVAALVGLSAVAARARASRARRALRDEFKGGEDT